MNNPSNKNWAEIHDQESSWRKKIVGEISDVFIVPRYIEFFYGHFGRDQEASFFEIGSGNGDMSKAVLAANQDQIGRYVVSEYFPEGVDWLTDRSQCHSGRRPKPTSRGCFLRRVLCPFSEEA